MYIYGAFGIKREEKMLFRNITILDENFEIKQNMYVGIEGERIEYIGEAEPQKDYGRSYDGKGKLLMCGFYNSHGHSPMALMRGYGENLALQDWLNIKIFPFEDKLDSNAVYWGTMLTMAESLRFGIVSTSDMYYFIDDMVAATGDAHMKANISRAIVGSSEDDLWRLPSMQEMKSCFEAYHNAYNGRIKMDVSIHAEYTSAPETVRAVAQYGSEVGTRLHIHASESRTEHEECKKKYGKTPIAYFRDLGALEIPTTAAHCVWLEGEDFDILKEKGVTVASNPISNMKLSSGVCNVPELLNRGINVAIGTDSVASNNSLNFFEEMKCFAMASKMMFNDPTAVTPKQTLYAATRGGALGQGRDDCGLLKEGFKADLIVVDIDKPNMYPVHNLLNNLVYSASGTDIVMTLVDGEPLYENGEYTTIDICRTIREANAATARIVEQLGRI